MLVTGIKVTENKFIMKIVQKEQGIILNRTGVFWY